jgi:putative addiction module component (TIGR02574 family)
MASSAIQILEGALRLPQEARAFLAERLLESLDAEPGPPISEDWLREIARRCEQIDRGEVALVPGDEVFRRAFEAVQ